MQAALAVGTVDRRARRRVTLIHAMKQDAISPAICNSSTVYVTIHASQLIEIAT